MKEALNEPDGVLVTMLGEVVCVTPPYFIVIVLLAAKPVPVTVTEVPTLPLEGPSEIAELTVNCLDGTPTQPFAVTVCKPAAEGLGMHGSGMFIVNPPWTLRPELEAALPWLAKRLGQDDHARFTLTWSSDSGTHPANTAAAGRRPVRQNRSPSRK